MSNPVNIWQELTWRELLYQSTEKEMESLLNKESFTLYAGFDPTSDSLHVGHLVPLLCLSRFQRAGHRPIAVAGGATGMVGDPSGRSEERNLLTREQIAANIDSIRPQLARLLDFDAGSHSAMLVDNASWLDGFNLLDFLRDVGKHFSINDMLKKDSVQSRMDSGISFTEFSYMLLQAYDFFHLNREHNCRIQIGGSDQWGNIVAGIDLIRRIRQQQAYGITFPLITGADGKKFGKTAEGTNCWLDAKKTSPYKFYQFFINIEDRDVIRLLRLFTFIPQEEIANLAQLCADQPEKRDAQKALARAMTEMIHGTDELKRSEAATQALFGGELNNLDERTLLEVFAEAPSADLSRNWFTEGRSLIDALVEAKIEDSKGNARKNIQGGGVYINNNRITDVKTNLSAEHLLYGKYSVIRRGKKNYYLLRAIE